MTAPKRATSPWWVLETLPKRSLALGVVCLIVTVVQLYELFRDHHDGKGWSSLLVFSTVIFAILTFQTLGSALWVRRNPPLPKPPPSETT